MYETGITTKNFVIRADFRWSIADQKNYSGYGFVFREEKKLIGSNYYLIELDALDGVMLSYRLDYMDSKKVVSPQIYTGVIMLISE